MKNPIRNKVLLSLAAAGMAMVCSNAQAQTKVDDPGVREAVRVERTKAAASERQVRLETSHPSRASEANTSDADRWAPDRLEGRNEAGARGESPNMDSKAVAEAIRYEKFKDAAAARQMRRDAKQ